MKYTSAQNNSTISLIVLIALLLVIGIWEISRYVPGESVTWIPPKNSHIASKHALWTRSDIFTDNQQQPLVIALKNTVVVLGSNDIKQQKSKVMAFSADSGNMLWQKNYDGSVITSTNSSIIVGGTREVLALNSTNGEVLWRTNVQANVTRFLVVEDALYVVGAASSHYHILDITNGDILEKVTGSLSLWDYPTYRDVLFRKTGEGDVIAVSQLNNKELWRSNVNGVSNLAMTELAIYILDKEGYLLQLEPETGFSEKIIEFIPSISLYSGENMGFKYPYYIAVDIDSASLFVYLGDSSQLFAYGIE